LSRFGRARGRNACFAPGYGTGVRVGTEDDTRPKGVHR
jgi:hypothetical protein